MNDALQEIGDLSPEKLALLHRALSRRNGGAAAAGIPRRKGGSVAPLSFGQQRLWFVDRLQPGTPLYNLPLVLRMGPTDPAVLQRVLDEVVRRHESLRTTFVVVDGRPVQVVSPPARVALAREDLSTLRPSEREAAAARRAAEEAARPFDLERGPLFRALLLRLSHGTFVLVLCMHHIVGDGWSLDVLYREMAALYPALASGRPSPLAEPELQYADYAEWQREHLSGERLDGPLRWWTAELAGAPTLLELPYDRPRPAVQSFRGGVHPLTIPPTVADGLRALARQEGATLFMVLLAAYQALLHRYSGGDDILVGSPIAGRTRRQTEEMIGFFVNTLVLRARFKPGLTFRELVRQVKETTLGAYAHQELPFERLVEALAPERSLAHNPLVQVVFALQNTPGSAPAADALPETGAPAPAGTAKFDLMLFLGEAGNGLEGGLEYSTDLFEPGTAARMAAHLQRLLASAVAAPDGRVAQLALLDPAERAALLEAGRAGPPEPPGLLHEVFEAAAARDPGAPALVWEGGALTYGEVAARADALAHRLRARGVGPEVRVGICLERSPELVVALLAVNKAGGAHLPLDPEYPPERLRAMLQDSGAALAITRTPLSGAIPGLPLLLIDEPAEEPPAGRVQCGAGPDNLAYVIYTSGSTGRPKGVLVAHRALATIAAEARRALRITARDRVLQFASPSFDASVFEMLTAWSAGASLYLAPREDLIPGPDLLRVLREGEISTVVLAPSALAALPPEPLPALRTVVSVGEACPAATQRRWMEGRSFVNAYGPTEATIWATWARCTDPAREPPLGAPVAGTPLYVLDAELEPVPPGVPGELCLGGHALARGYHGRPGLTADRFVPDPFGGEGGRLYRTGDLVRRRADGTLEYLGRVDRQLKVRGFRVEPGEVEAALRRHPGVGDAVVDARDDASGHRVLVAWIRPAPGESPAAAELRAALRDTLPPHMVPTHFVEIGEVPLTPSGKVDRRALPAPAGGEPEAAFVAPRTPAEEAVAAVWREVLAVERVGVHDSFFDLGGHSLLAPQVVSRIADACGVEVPLRRLFEAPTLEAFAAEVAAARPVAAPERIRARTGPPELEQARVAALTDDEVMEALRRLLAEGRAPHPAGPR